MWATEKAILMAQQVMAQNCHLMSKTGSGSLVVKKLVCSPWQPFCVIRVISQSKKNQPLSDITNKSVPSGMHDGEDPAVGPVHWEVNPIMNRGGHSYLRCHYGVGLGVNGGRPTAWIMHRVFSH